MKYISALFLVAALAFIGQQSSISFVEAGAVGKYMDDAKNYLITMFRDRVISRSVLVTNFEETMNKIKTRYAEAKANGETANMTPDEEEAFYYKIVVEETKKLRESVENQANMVKGPIDPNTPANQLAPEHMKILSELEIEQAADDDEQELLSNELDEIASNEAEMGMSMSPEAKAAMKARTKQVMTDLMSNEMRQLAMAILTSYFTGGPISGAVTTVVATSVKFKIVEYLMNIVMDVLSSAMGRRINITSALPAPPAGAAA